MNPQASHVHRTPLWTHLALRSDYPVGTCWAWVESKGAVCGRPDEVDSPHLCKRHATVARRRADEEVAREARRTARREDEALSKLDVYRERLDAIDSEMRRLDPPPPTTDPAAWGGVAHAGAARYRARFTPERIARLAKLSDERKVVAGRLRYAESVRAAREAAAHA